MKKNLGILIGLFIIIVLAGLVIFFLPSDTATAPTNTDVEVQAQRASIPDIIVVDTPLINMIVGSPLTITGSARGTWYFEASFPVELKDANGKTIAQVPAQAQDDWMTEEFVPFSASLTYPAQPSGSTGTLILHKDNPSGEPERDQSLSIPVTF